MSLLGGILGAAGSLFGGKAKAPKAVYQKPIDWATEQANAVNANLSNLSGIQSLTSQTNTYNQSEATRLMEAALPGFSKLQSQLMNTAQSQLTNPYALPDEVTQNLSRLAAERGISAGTRGQFSDFSLLRDFGINSLQYGQSRINTAQSLASTLASISPRVNPMSPISMFINPTQVAATTQQQNISNQQVGQSYENAKTAASNYNNANLGNTISSLAGSVNWSALFGT